MHSRQHCVVRVSSKSLYEFWSVCLLHRLGRQRVLVAVAEGVFTKPTNGGAHPSLTARRGCYLGFGLVVVFFGRASGSVVLPGVGKPRQVINSRNL